MSEYINTISSEDLINYWKTFFEDKMSIDEINNMLKAVSNTDTTQIISENKAFDFQLEDSLIWGKIKNENLLQQMLETSKDRCCWGCFFEPVLKKHFDTLIDTINECVIISNIETFLLGVVTSMLTQLNQIANQTLIIELYYAKQNNLLKGKTKEERGQYFLNVLLKDDAYRKEIYLNYPELTRLLEVKVKFITDYIIKIIYDTNKEISNIELYLNNNKKIGKIKNLYMGEGDTHNKGKSVVRLIFDSDKILIYKPHKLGIDEKYYEFIQWLNSLNIIEDSKENLLAVKSYSIDDAGWVEYIEYSECDNEEDLEHFYYRMGRTLCLVHTLNGNDMHSENVIAHKSMPVLIDLETLLHPDIHSNIAAESAVEIAINEVIGAVTSTHLLPSKIVNAKNNKILEIGGLGACIEQESPFKSKYIDGYGTDDVRVLKRYGVIQPNNNNPIYKKQLIDAKSYKENIASGFKDMYKWILQNKEVYANKVNSIFENCDIRILYKGTNIYAQVLFSSFHPDLLTSYTDRYLFLHRIATDYKNKNHKILQIEIRDLLQGDIPYFSTNTSQNIVDRLNIIKKVSTTNSSTIKKVLEKINNMSEIKMYRQITAINTSFMTDFDNGHIKPTLTFQNNKKRKYTKEDFIKKASEIADYMLERSIVGEKSDIKSRTWLEAQDIDLGFKIYDNANANLYSGLAGIALFYNYLWRVSLNIEYKKVANEIIVSIIENIPKEHDLELYNNVKSGAFNGMGGILYALFYLDYSNNTNIYEDDILNIFDILFNSIDKSETNDIINKAGNLGIMISIYEKSQNEKFRNIALEIANMIFEDLNKNKIVIDNFPGISWSKDGSTGYSHGNSGTIAQLYRLYNITKNNAILDLIDEALLFERSMFSPEDNKWFKSIKDKNGVCGWCHGAAGILLSKLQLKKLGYQDSLINNEIYTAIENIKKNGLKNDITLCHGAFGNMSILKDAAILLDDIDLYNESVATIDLLVDFILSLMKTESFKEKEYNGFMVGLSGIAYELLRVEREYELPNILGLE